jgi:cysteine desulfurase
LLYLDNSSTTKTNKEVINTINSVMEKYWGNPSSLHEMGVMSERVLKQSRKILSDFLEVSSDEIYFTSGGTESNNLFIKGVLEEYKERGNHIITTKIEHPSVLEVIRSYEKNGWKVSWLDVDEFGLVSLEELKNEISQETVLTAIMHVNNETGAIQPIEEAAKIVKERSRSLFFSDGVQGFLKVPFSLKDRKIDGYSISGHKINGPKGIGAIYINNKIRIKPVFLGGGQEKGLRSGTENVPGIAGLAKAVQLYKDDYLSLAEENLLKKKKFAEKLKEVISSIKINSYIDERSSSYILNCSLPSIRGETILHFLEENKIYVSTGSACSGKDKSYSHVLKAMNLDEKYLKGAIRISMALGQWPEEKEINYIIEKLKEALERLG